MRDSLGHTFKIALSVCGVCSILVSLAAVSLKATQEKNKQLDRKRNILIAGGLLQEGEPAGGKKVNDLYVNIREEFIDLKSGSREDMEKASDFDAKKASKSPATSLRFDTKEGAGEARQIARKALLYHLVKDGKIVGIILPIHGKGLWSTLYGFLCLSNDTRTVIGITFYEHAETPGLGGEVDNPQWKALWPGRKVSDEDFEVRFDVLKGKAGPVEEDPHRVDGLSGATITSRGVSSMIRFWMGKNGYAPYLEKLRREIHGQTSKKSSS